MKPSEAIQIAVLNTELKNLTEKVETLTVQISKFSDKIDKNYVTVADFSEIKAKVEKLWDRFWWMSGAAFVLGGLADFLLRRIFNV